MSDSPRSNGVTSYYPGLDGVRGLSVLVVMVHHGVMLTTPPGVADWLFRIATFGWAGVDVFFVLSGFLITGILMDTRADPHYFRCFYMRRALRIFPLYYFTILFFSCAGAAVHALSPAQASALHHDQAWFWAYLQNVFFAVHPESPLDHTLGHLWSLAVEEQFYLFWPLCVALLDDRNLRRTTLVAIAIALVLRIAVFTSSQRAPWMYVLVSNRPDALAIGALLATLLRAREGGPDWAVWFRRIAWASMAAIVVIFSWGRPHTFGFWTLKVRLFGYSAVDALSFALVGAVVLSSKTELLARAFRVRWLSWLGRYSYALYVLHFPVMVVAKDQFLQGHSLETPAQRVAFSLGFMAVSCALAYVSRVAIEQPFLQMKRFFPYASPPEVQVATGAAQE